MKRTTLCAGFGKAEITPPHDGGGTQDLRILGFWHDRAKRYGAIHDPLYARAAAFALGGEWAALVSLDLIGDAVGITARARRRLRDALGLSPDRVMIVCTHSHTTPETLRLSDHPVSETWLDHVVEGIRNAVMQAKEALQPSRLRLGETATSGLAQNRRAAYNAEAWRRLPAEARERQGFLDETLRAAVVESTAGARLGVIVNFALHPVTMQTEPFISADYPGVAMQRIESGGGAALFTNAACGDVNPLRMGSWDAVEWNGRSVADAAEAAAASAVGVESASVLRVETRRVPVPRRTTRPPQILVDERARLETEAAAARDLDPDTPSRHPGRDLYMVNEELHIARSPAEIEVEVQCLRIGDWMLTGVSGELAGCLGDDIRRAAHRCRVWVAGYANGYAGYILPREAFDLGGYETRPGRWSLLAPGAGDTVRDAAVALVRTMDP